MLTTLGAKEQCFKGCENNWSADPMGVFTTIAPWKIAKITPIDFFGFSRVKSIEIRKVKNLFQFEINNLNSIHNSSLVK